MSRARISHPEQHTLFSAADLRQHERLFPTERLFSAPKISQPSSELSFSLILEGERVVPGLCDAIGLPWLKEGRVVASQFGPTVLVSTDNFQRLRSYPYLDEFKLNENSDPQIALHVASFGNGVLSHASKEFLEVVALSRHQNACAPYTPTSLVTLYLSANEVNGSLHICPSSYGTVAAHYPLENINAREILKSSFKTRMKFNSEIPLILLDKKPAKFGGYFLQVTDGRHLLNCFATHDRYDGIDIGGIALGALLTIEGEFEFSKRGSKDDLNTQKLRKPTLKITNLHCHASVVKPQEFSFTTKQSKFIRPKGPREEIVVERRLTNLNEQLSKEDFVAVDLETTRSLVDPRQHTIAVCQVCTPELKSYLVFNNGLAHLVDLKSFLEATEKIKIIHYSPFERARFKEAGIKLQGVYDTYEQSRILFPQLPNHKLDTILHWVHGVSVDKRYQSSDWSEDLTPEQLDYAQNDVEQLIHLYRCQNAVRSLALLPLDVILKWKRALQKPAEATFSKRITALQERLSKNHPAISIETVTFEEIWRELYETDKALDKLLEQLAPQLAVVDERIEQLRSRIEDLLIERGDLPYKSEVGSVAYGSPVRLCNAEELKYRVNNKDEEINRYSMVRVAHLNEALEEMHYSIARKVQEKLERLVSQFDPDLYAPEDLEIYFADTFTAAPRTLQSAGSERWNAKGSIHEMMTEYNELVVRNLNVIFKSAPILSVLNARRSILIESLKDRVVDKESLPFQFGEVVSEWGVISQVPKYAGVSLEKILKVVDTDPLLTDPEKEYAQSIFSNLPRWISPGVAKKIVADCYPTLSEDDILPLLRKTAVATGVFNNPVVQASGKEFVQ